MMNNTNVTTPTERNEGKLHLVLKRSSIVKFAVFQLLVLAVIITAIIVVCLLTIKKDTQVIEKEITVEVPVETEPQIIEKEVLVEVPVETEVVKEVEVPVEVIKEVEVPVEVIKEVEVPVEVVVEKEVPVEVVKEVVDEEAVEALANEKAEVLYNELRSSYVAQADSQLVEQTVNEKYEELKASYVAQADATEVETLANEKALALLEEFKAQFIAEKEAELAAAVSTIRVYIYGGKETFYLYITGQMYERLTYDKIYAALQADVRFEGYKVNRIANKDAVEVFIGEDYTSTRSIRIELK